MFRYALKEDKVFLKKLWDEYFGFDGLKFNEFFFNELFDRAKHYLLIEDEIVSVASVFKQNLSLNNKILKTSLICGVITLKKFQRQGKMRQLLNLIIDHLSHQELVTLIEAYHPEVYESFGFEVIYQRRKYYVDKIFQNSLKIAVDYQVEDLIRLYAQFMKHFNAYKIRDVDDFKLLLKQVSYEAKIIVVKDENSFLGYAIYELNDNIAHINEIIYLNKQALESLIAIIQKEASEVIIYTSCYEKLDKIYHFKYEEYAYGLARINNLEVFNRLYQSDVKNAKEAFVKALWYREDF